MDFKRRDFMKMMPLGVLFPGQFLYGLSGPDKANNHRSNSIKPRPSFENYSDAKTAGAQYQKIDEVYENAIVIDALIIARGWNEISFAAAEKSGYTGFGTSLSSGSLKSALRSIEEWKKRIEENASRLIFVKTAEDFVNAKKEGKLAIMMGFQNSTMIEKSIDNVDVLYKAGTRWIQLTYNDRNLLGDGCTERTNAGLSDFGVAAVQRMNELGIIVDLSHCGRQTTFDGIEFSNPGPCFTHTMCESLYRNHPRSKTDAQIKAMADKGGVMGIICLGYMIGPDPGGETTIETYVDHIDHAVKVGGIDHVGVAGDIAIQGISEGATRENWYVPRLTSFKPSYEVRWPPWIPGLETPERYKMVARILDKRGYSTGDIEKILGQNWLRYYRDTLKS